MATAEEISRSYWKAEMAHDLDGVLRHYRDDATFEGPGVLAKGTEELREFYGGSFSAFPKLEHEVVRVIGDANVACLEWHAWLTDHAGTRHELRGVNLAEVDGERFIRVRAYFDRFLDVTGSQ